VVFGRAPVATERVGRAALEAWAEALVASGLPLALVEPGRPRFSMGAPLAAGLEGRGELLDLWLTERLPLWRLRSALETVLPADHWFVSAEDVWVGAPPLPGRVAGADYLVELEDPPERGALDAACARLRNAAAIPRVREKAGVAKPYDLRPLLIDVAPADRASGSAVRMRTRIHPELGSGRPEEVTAALADELGRPMSIARMIRERLLLAENLADRSRLD
jgi:radical SAM-linked protein